MQRGMVGMTEEGEMEADDPLNGAAERRRLDQI